MSNCWEILGVEDTADEKTVKAAYAKLIKQFKPEEHANEFSEIRQAYEEVLLLIRNKITVSSNMDEVDSNVDFSEVSSSFEYPEIEYDIRVSSSEDIYRDLISIYRDPETRNNLAAWQSILDKYKFHLLENETIGLSVLDEIMKSELFYITETPLDVGIYIILIDFFNIDFDKFLLATYNSTITKPLRSQILARRHSNKLSETPDTEFNQKDACKELLAEEFLERAVLGSRHLDLKSRLESLETIIKQDVYEDEDSHIVIRRVLFRYILDTYVNATANLDDETSALIYHWCWLQDYKSEFLKLFVKLGYYKNDIKNCFNYCEQAHELKFKKGSTFQFFWICAVVFFILCYLFKTMAAGS